MGIPMDLDFPFVFLLCTFHIADPHEIRVKIGSNPTPSVLFP